MTDVPAIEFLQVTKRYGSLRALDGASLRVPSGMIFGFLGPNGAGKTTALRIAMGMIRCSDGTARVLGMDPWTARDRLHARVGYAPSGMGFYERMSGRDLLEYAVALRGGRRGTGAPLLDRTIDALALSRAVLERPISTYSKGMRQKLAIAQALQHDPELVLLDEPSEGLDPLVQHAMYELLRERRDAGRTVFFSSHTLSEVQALCERVAIVRAGSIVADATYEELAAHHPRVVRLVGLDDPDACAVQLGAGWRRVDQEGDTTTFHTTEPPAQIVQALGDVRFDDVTIEPPSLEDVFLEFYEAGVDSGPGATA